MHYNVLSDDAIYALKDESDKRLYRFPIAFKDMRSVAEFVLNTKLPELFHIYRICDEGNGVFNYQHGTFLCNIFRQEKINLEPSFDITLKHLLEGEVDKNMPHISLRCEDKVLDSFSVAALLKARSIKKLEVNDEILATHVLNTDNNFDLCQTLFSTLPIETQVLYHKKDIYMDVHHKDKIEDMVKAFLYKKHFSFPSQPFF